MMSRFRKWLPALLAVAGFALGAPRDAHAILAIAFEVSAPAQTTVTAFAVDNNVIPGGYVGSGTQVMDINPTVGILELATISLFGGNYLVSGSSQSQTIATAPGSFNILQSGAATITNNTGGQVLARVAIAGGGVPGPGPTPYVFQGPASQFIATASTTWTNAQGPGGNSNIVLNWFNDPANGQGAESATDAPGNLVFGPVTQTANFAGESDATNSGLLPLPVPDPDGFSMALRFDLTTFDADAIAGNNIAGSVTSRGQAELKPLGVVPEPGTTAMIISGLPVLSMLWVRRRRQQA